MLTSSASSITRTSQRSWTHARKKWRRYDCEDQNILDKPDSILRYLPSSARTCMKLETETILYRLYGLEPLKFIPLCMHA